MGYEVKKEEMTQEKWDEMKRIARDEVCAECGAELTVHTVAERGTIEVGCLVPGHHGFIERETYTEAFRRGEPVHPAIQAAIEKKMIPKDELGRAMNLLALRYPDAIKDPPTASLFIMDCARLDLDPLISPAEAVPVAFKRRIKKDGQVEEKVTGGYGWHSIRRALTTELVLSGASALNVLRFLRWSDASTRGEFGMLTIYAKKDQARIDEEIFKIHPFLPFWGGIDADCETVSTRVSNSGFHREPEAENLASLRS